VPKLLQEKKIHKHLRVFNKNQNIELTRTQNISHTSNQYSTCKQHQDSSKDTRKSLEILWNFPRALRHGRGCKQQDSSQTHRKGGVYIANSQTETAWA
jgi:hypothetical protein